LNANGLELLARISHQGGKLRLKVSMVNIRTATPQINRVGTAPNGSIE
jgi:hypothetical protein